MSANEGRARQFVTRRRISTGLSINQKGKGKKHEAKAIRLTVTERQLTIIKSACEDYLRTRMGQFFDLATDISDAGKKGRMSNVEFEEMIARRNAAQQLMISAFQLMQPIMQNKTEQELERENILLRSLIQK